MDLGRETVVLIIEDDTEFVDDLLRSWRLPGTVLRATTGSEAVQAILRYRPDLILLDLAFPHYLAEVDGEEGARVLGLIRDQLRLAIPVIVITRDGSLEKRRRTLQLGADGLLEKPVDIRELEQLVARLEAIPEGRPTGRATKSEQGGW